MVEIDKREMLVTLYFAGISGTPSPVMQLHGRESKLYEKYLDQFKYIWKHSSELEKQEYESYAKCTREQHHFKDESKFDNKK